MDENRWVRSLEGEKQDKDMLPEENGQMHSETGASSQLPNLWKQ
jgi:hypothetical protein